MPLKLNLLVSSEDKDLKVIDFLRERAEISSRLLRKLKKEKHIRVNGYVISLNALLRTGDEIEVIMPTEDNIFEPEDIPIDVIYENDYFIIINKQAFLVVHPTKGHPFNTIANGLANYIHNRGESYKIRFANRLDRDTSGLMIVCKNGYSQKIISDQMIANKIEKKYYAVVSGIVKDDNGTIDLPIGLLNEDDIERSVFEGGYESITHYKVVERFRGSQEDATLVEIILETGRTHQIRVHFKAIGHTLLGDILYGGNHELINRQALHAFSLKMKNIDGELQNHVKEMPKDMIDLIEGLRG